MLRPAVRDALRKIRVRQEPIRRDHNPPWGSERTSQQLGRWHCG